MSIQRSGVEDVWNEIMTYCARLEGDSSRVEGDAFADESERLGVS